MEKTNQKQIVNQIMYVPVRYGQILGVYENQDDAMQVVSSSINKNQLCDLIIKPIIKSFNSNQNQIVSQVVYIPVRYGQILGLYENQEDAMQIVSSSINKNQPCDLVIRPIIKSLKFN